MSISCALKVVPIVLLLVLFALEGSLGLFRVSSIGWFMSVISE
ncbi:hypothetical protein V6Z11_A09G062900 [Gossypium hirsutum]